jgi:hypothetical protein
MQDGRVLVPAGSVVQGIVSAWTRQVAVSTVLAR